MSINKTVVCLGATCAVTVFGCSSEGGMPQEPVKLDVQSGVVDPGARPGAPPPLDTDGTPDLVVRHDMLMSKWSVKSESFTDSNCAAVEGGISAGQHRVVRFTVGTANIGTADMIVGNPVEHVADGLFELSTCHNHYHFRNYATYELVNAAGKTWRAAKQGFCMIDTDRNTREYGQPDRPAIFTSCGSLTAPGFQGISRGWTDTYGYQLQGQFFVLDGGDGQDVVPPGQYTLRITVNPPFVPTAIDKRCEDPRHIDAQGLCHQLIESDYTNNIAERTVTVP